MNSIFLILAIFVGQQPNFNPPSEKLLIPRSVSEFVMGNSISSTNTPYFYTNEFRPSKGKEIHALMPKNTGYLSAGADRGYTNGALANAAFLVMIDRDTGVILYSHIITLLLRASNDGMHYREMRLDTSKWANLENLFEIEGNVISKKEFIERIKVFYETVADFAEEYFEVYYAKPGTSKYCRPKGKSPISKLAFEASQHTTFLCDGGGDEPMFDGASIFYDETLFERAQRLAQTVRIVELDISNTKEVEALALNLAVSGRELGIVDTSNIFPLKSVCGIERTSHADYQGGGQQTDSLYVEKTSFVHDFLTALKPALHKDALLSVTESLVIGKSCDIYQVETKVAVNGCKAKFLRKPLPVWTWSYKGSRISDLLWGNCEPLIEK